MTQSWQSEINLNPETARQLVEAQCLPVSSFELIGEGWDNWAYLANREFVFRFPRRRIAVGLLQTEMQVLPLLQPHLTISIPVALYVGEPTELFAAPFAGYRFIAGVTADRAMPSSTDAAAIAASLGEFLRCLHSIPIDPSVRSWAPVDTIRRSDLTYRLHQMQERIIYLHDILGEDRCHEIIAIASGLSTACPLAGETCWVHGDLYARHMLIENNTLSGVIDWGDVHLGDPALDLSIAYSLFESESRTAFFDTYGRIDEETQNRARFRSLFYGILLSHYGAETGDLAIRDVGLHALSSATK